jgi:cell division topological specificity factor
MKKWIHQVMGKKTAHIAKDRLRIIIAQERTENSQPDYLPLLRKEILEVVAKYTKIDVQQVRVDLQCYENNSVLELNVVLPQVQDSILS